MLTQWSLDWIVNQKKVFPNDGDAEFFMKVVEQYKLTKDVVPTYQYAVDQSAGKTDKSVHINGSQNQVFQKAAVGNNLGEGTLSIGSLIFKSELTETEKLAILQMNEEVTQLNGEVKYLMAEIEGMKKLLAAKEEVISALKGQNK